MKPKILVVEDEVIIALDLQKILKKMDYDVPAIANSGIRAIKEAKKHRPDLVLMDIKLQGDVDGIETANELRTRFNIPVIFITAYAEDDMTEQVKPAEPYGYLVKPFNEKELKIALEVALGN